MAGSTCLHSLVAATFILAAAMALASPADTPPIEVVVAQARLDVAGQKIVVDLRLLNDGDRAVSYTLPEIVTARVMQEGAERAIALRCQQGTTRILMLPPTGFVKLDCHGDLETVLKSGTLSIPEWGSAEVSIKADERTTRMATAQPSPVKAVSPEAGEELNAAPPGDRRAGNAFAGNLAPYEPIYAVYGPGTDSAARIQISFKYRLFGSRESAGLGPSWRDGLHFAYTQRMFWDVNARSSPFRNVDYLPELFYLTRPITLDEGFILGGQFGVRHESNGRAGEQSRSLNSVYLAPMAAIQLSNGYRLTVGPRLSFLIGDSSDNPNIMRYRGATSLFMEVGRKDGLRLSTSTRFNVSSGKGALGADISYPLNRLWSGGPDLYLYGQSFLGYGENLLDYDRKVTRLRIGLAIIR